MPGEDWVIDLRHAYHQKQKTYIKYSSWLHPGETFYLLVCSIFTPQFNSTYSWHFIFLYICHQFMLIFFACDNDDMETSKGRVTILSLILFQNVCRNRSLSEILSALLLVSLLLIVRFQYITFFQSLANVQMNFLNLILL